MSLTKKQKKYFKKQVQDKLTEMGIKDEIQYTKTGFSKVGRYYDMELFKEVEKKIDTYRAANLYSSLCKKILNLPLEGVTRFLSSNNKPKEPDGNQIQEIALDSPNQ